jgi:hypothetical protein
VTGAAIAGAGAAAAYIDAKYHIRKDLANIREQKKIGQIAQRRGGSIRQEHQDPWAVLTINP